MPETKLIIFDLDGTLIDTVVLVVNSMSSAFTKLGHVAPSESAIRSISGLRLDIALRQLAPNLNEDQIDLIFEKYRQTYLNSVYDTATEPLFEGVLELIEELNKRDDVLLAVATGKPMLGTKRVLVKHNIIDYFTSLQTPDNNASKPNPEMIYSAMSIAGVAKENSIMIGDTTHDIDMAQNAGVKSIGVGWGYHSKQDLMGAGATKFIDGFSNMTKEIDRLFNA